MEKSLSQRTTYNPQLLLKISQAAGNLDKASRLEKADLTTSKEIIGLLEETLAASELSPPPRITPIGSSEWYSALSIRLIPKLYGILQGMPYRKEHFEAGLYFILEQLKDIETASQPQLEFARHIICELGRSLLKEKNAWFRQLTYSNPYKRAAA
jgi:hypothetical protein